MGGTLLTGGLEWASFFFGSVCLPPDPMLVGDGWRAMWLQRLENVPLFFELWLQHQRRDAYWKHGSVCEDYEAIQCPVYAVGGWTDAYKNAIPRLLERLKAPRKGLIGPWAHAYPHFALPGPQIGFLQEMLRWWDYWLKGVDTGVMDEPILRAWMTESVKPASHHDVLPGRWVAEPSWPSPNITPQRLFLTDDGLRRAAAPLTARAVRSSQTVGRCAGNWAPFGRRHDLAGDQQEDDLHSLVFETPPLEASVEILGAAIVALEVTCDRPIVNLEVRLCDVHPSGESSRVSYGALNLTHRHGHEKPVPLAIGERYRVRIQLNDAGSVFPAGHRIRLALSTAYWPMIWPSPEQATLMILAGTLDLPVRPAQPADGLLSPLPGPESALPERPTIFSVTVMCVSSALDWNWVQRANPIITSRRMTRLAPSPSCDGSRRCHGTGGKYASRRRCGCHAHVTRSSCMGVCARGKVRMKSAIGNGIAPLLGISHDELIDGSLASEEHCGLVG
jgi:hypothetical protein